MTLYINPYKRGSASAKLLRQTLHINNLKASTLLQDGDVILNWGQGIEMPASAEGKDIHVINDARSIKRSISKVDSLEVINSMRYFTDRTSLLEHVEGLGGMPAGMVIYCRTLTRASRGRGIVVAKTIEGIINAPLYTLGYPCKREYRVHVFNHSVIDLVAKVRIMDTSSPKYKETPDPYVRSSETGYTFARNAVTIPRSVKDNLNHHACNAVDRLGLDFGAVDIVRDVNNVYSVLEVNTAPGIMGTALSSYVSSINDHLRSILGREVLHSEEEDAESGAGSHYISPIKRMLKRSPRGSTMPTFGEF